MAGGVTYRRSRLPGAINGSFGNLNTLLRGSTDVVHAAAGAITTNVDVTSAGISSLSKAIEHLTGYLQTTSTRTYHHAKIILTSITNLEITTRVEYAATIRVEWEILEAIGTIQRLEVGGASSATITTFNTTITDVGNLNKARIYNNGEMSSNYETLRFAASHYLTTTTNLRTYMAFTNAGRTLAAPVVIEY